MCQPQRDNDLNLIDNNTEDSQDTRVFWKQIKHVTVSCGYMFAFNKILVTSWWKKLVKCDIDGAEFSSWSNNICYIYMIEKSLHQSDTSSEQCGQSGAFNLQMRTDTAEKIRL